MIFSFFPDTCLFKGIAPHDIKTLMDYFDSEEKEYKKGDIIFRAGTATPKIGIIEKGTANVVINHPWGTSSVFGQLKDGDVFGCEHCVKCRDAYQWWEDNKPDDRPEDD